MVVAKRGSGGGSGGTQVETARRKEVERDAREDEEGKVALDPCGYIVVSLPVSRRLIRRTVVFLHLLPSCRRARP